MLDYAALSSIGRRYTNEDFIGTEQKAENSCFVVCDGLGGHGMGDAASRLVTEVFLESFRSGDPDGDFLPMTFQTAQETLRTRQQEQGATNKMRTTAAVAVTDGKTVFVGHVGDSRVYLFDREGIGQRTLDHSVPQMLVMAGEIADSQIRKHPDRNKLLRAMGTDWEQPMYTLMPPVPLSQCRGLLLCSDGFWEYITEEEMVTALQHSATARQWLDAMIAVVQKAGCNEKMDNYSAVAVLNTDFQ